MDRVSVAEAAQRLGVSQDAVYTRIKRGTIPWEKGEDDKTYVYIDESTDGPKSSADHQFDASNYVSKDELMAELRNRIRFLEDELQRKDAILMTLAQRVPELESAREAPSEPRDAPEPPPDTEGKGAAPPEEERRSWWQRIFGTSA